MYYTRSLGRTTIRNEMERSRRRDEPFVLAFVDIDGLDELNAREGVVAGTALLNDVIHALQSNLRANDPIVRVGGDEFLCGLTNTDLPTARRRFDEIRTVLEHTRAASTHPPETDSITVGLASLRESDTAELLTDRADLDMYFHKQTRRRKPLKANPVVVNNPTADFAGWQLPDPARGWDPPQGARAFDPWPAHKPGLRSDTPEHV
jgi:diguanylate cyclase (GGDEF)-like protein